MASQRKNSLPIHIDEEVLEKNPKFSQLLRILSNRMTPEGISIETKHEMEMAEKNVRLAHQGWLMNHIPYYELRELITDMELKSMEGSLSLDEEQLTKVLSEAVAFSELPDYLPLPSGPSQNLNLLGLTLEDLDRHNHTKQHLPVIQKVVLPMLEERLLKKNQDLHDFFTPQNDSERGKHEGFSLPCIVEEKKQQLTREKVSLQRLEEKRRENFMSYYQSLLECLSSLERIISCHKLEVQTESDRVSLHWMDACCAALCTKAKLTILQLDCDTYSPRKVAALKQIRFHLEKAIRECQRELSKTMQQVGVYRAVGTEFKKLVEEYTMIKKEIDDCSWGLKQFAATAGGDNKG